MSSRIAGTKTVVLAVLDPIALGTGTRSAQVLEDAVLLSGRSPRGSVLFATPEDVGGLSPGAEHARFVVFVRTPISLLGVLDCSPASSDRRALISSPLRERAASRFLVLGTKPPVTITNGQGRLSCKSPAPPQVLIAGWHP